MYNVILELLSFNGMLTFLSKYLYTITWAEAGRHRLTLPIMGSLDRVKTEEKIVSIIFHVYFFQPVSFCNTSLGIAKSYKYTKR